MAKGQAGRWRRWNRKLPHNRVWRPRIHDAQGRRIGYGPPTPIAEPEVHPFFSKKVWLPSGRWDMELDGAHVEEAYRLARRPVATEAEVKPLPIEEAFIRRLHTELIGLA